MLACLAPTHIQGQTGEQLALVGKQHRLSARVDISLAGTGGAAIEISQHISRCSLPDGNGVPCPLPGDKLAWERIV
jgi:hypothetical protein